MIPSRFPVPLAGKAAGSPTPGAPAASEVRRIMAPRRREDFRSLLRFLSAFFRMVWRRRHSKVRIRDPPRPILATVVRQASVEGARSCVSGRYSGIQFFFVFTHVVPRLALLIYNCHHWRWLLLSVWVLQGLSTTTSRISTTTSSSTTSFNRL